MKNTCHIIGISAPVLSPEQKEMLQSCVLIVGGRRLLQLCEEFPVATLAVTPLKDALQGIKSALAEGDVAVLASGDPLFFGIGKRLIETFGADAIQVYPALSSLQLAFARFKLSWDDARIVSLHGRTPVHIPGTVLRTPKTFLFTDHVNTPNRVAKEIVDYLENIQHFELLESCKVLVAEDLENHGEKIFTGSLQETADSSFSPLNVMCLLCPPRERQSVFGLHENELQHSRGLITKAEVRAVSLHQLRLPENGVLWDVGAGSGSVSIEAARMNPGLTVYAVEKKNEELENIRANIRRYGCYNVLPVAGAAMDVLADLPDPDRVFIGGNGGQLRGIIEESAGRLPPGGLVVANGVIEKTVTLAPQYMKACGLVVNSSRILYSRRDEMDEVVDFNPITIIVGGKFV